jgi:hypothetical protein
MPSVSVNPPKTPVTKGSNSVAAATVPNVCKMPGPPAPFVPTPLPNIGRSSLSPEGFTTTVMVEGQPVAIRGASFRSMGDVASQGTGGGIVSNNVEGPTKFVAPGSLNVQFEGKNVHYLGDQMVNNCGPGGSPPNAATMMGVMHAMAMGGPGHGGEVQVVKCNVESSAKRDWNCCQMKQFCAKLAAVSEQTRRGSTTRDPANIEKRDRRRGEELFRTRWNEAPLAWQPIQHKFYHPCAARQAAQNGYQIGEEFQPDHVHEIQLGGAPTDFKNLRWLDTSVNQSLGATLTSFDPQKTPGGITADCCPADERQCAGKADHDPVIA